MIYCLDVIRYLTTKIVLKHQTEAKWLDWDQTEYGRQQQAMQTSRFAIKMVQYQGCKEWVLEIQYDAILGYTYIVALEDYHTACRSLRAKKLQRILWTLKKNASTSPKKKW